MVVWARCTPLSRVALAERPRRRGADTDARLYHESREQNGPAAPAAPRPILGAETRRVRTSVALLLIGLVIAGQVFAQSAAVPYPQE